MQAHVCVDSGLNGGSYVDVLGDRWRQPRDSYGQIYQLGLCVSFERRAFSEFLPCFSLPCSLVQDGADV